MVRGHIKNHEAVIISPLPGGPTENWGWLHSWLASWTITTIDPFNSTLSECTLLEKIEEIHRAGSSLRNDILESHGRQYIWISEASNDQTKPKQMLSSILLFYFCLKNNSLSLPSQSWNNQSREYKLKSDPLHVFFVFCSPVQNGGAAFNN